MRKSGNTKQIVGFFVLALLLIAVCYPRFNRQNISIIQNYTGKLDGESSMGDSKIYIDYVRYFRGDATVGLSDIGVPFLYRPLVPILASRLTFLDPMTAINVLNLACLMLSLFFLLKWLILLRFPFNSVFLGGILFIISFPTFYYGAIGYVDSCMFPVFTGGLILIYEERFKYLPVLLFASTFIREAGFLLIPVATVYLIVSRKAWIVKTILCFSSFILGIIIMRIAFRSFGHYIWRPNIESFLLNIRPRAILSILLTFGIPGIGFLLFLFKYGELRKKLDRKIYLPLMAGSLCTIFLVLFLYFSVYSDGRYIWPLTVFSMPMALTAFQRRNL